MGKKTQIYLLIIASLLFNQSFLLAQSQKKLPNIVFIMTDQWRAQATGYAGDKNVITPNLDQLAAESINVKNAVSGMPVCTPYRASLLTGQYPLTNGVFMNDVMLDTGSLTIAKVYKQHGYNTGYIGKWHIDGHGRSGYIPETRRQGFEYWKVLECTHDYNNSAYYSGNSQQKLLWEGYDAIAQTDDACQYITGHSDQSQPFMLFLSLAPPHDPYQTAPEEYRKIYENKEIKINANVPASMRERAQKDLRGYYAHISAIDECIGKIRQTLRKENVEDNTILVFTSDHGDLLGAHGKWNKQQPYEESIRVPFLIHYPSLFGRIARSSPILLNSPDIMPTLLGLCELPVPATVEGVDFSAVLKGTGKNKVKQTLISCVQPFGQWNRNRGGKEFRGIVTEQYTYVKDLNGPWLLFDNLKDPFQLENLCGNKIYHKVERKLRRQLKILLRKRGDKFKPGMEYVKEWNYVVDETETIPYKKINFQGKPINE